MSSIIKKILYLFFVLLFGVFFILPVKSQPRVVPLDSIPIAFTASSALVQYINDVLRSTDQVNIPVPDHDLASQILLPKKSMASPSLDSAMNWPDSLFNHIDIYGYDFEHWPYTPDTEKADPVLSSQQAQDFAHKHGLLYNLGPDLAYASKVGSQMAVYADGFAIQLQKLQHNPELFTDTLKALSSRIRAANSKIKIWAQIGAEVSGVTRTVQEMLIAADSARKYVDGIGIFYGTAIDTLKRFISIIRLGHGATSTTNVQTLSNSFKVFPNPFSIATNFDLHIGFSSYVSLKIFDLKGEEVATLVSKVIPAGSYSLRWSAQGLKSGVYFCALQIGTYKETEKIVLLR